MRLIYISISFYLGLLCTSLAAARTATLFTSGFNAAAYGDLAIDQGAWLGESISLLRIKAGVQLARIGPAALTLGYQKNGFYTAQQNWDREAGSLKLDYRGPVLELHLFSGAPFTFAVAASINDGYLFRKEEDPAAYGTESCQGRDPCQVLLERSKVRVAEYTGQIGFRIARELYLTLAYGQRHSEVKPSYEIQAAEGSDSEFVEAESLKSENDEGFFLVGLRGSQL